MRTTTRRTLVALIAAVPLFVGCTSSADDQATQPTTLAVNTAGITESTLPIAPPNATVPPTAPLVTAPPTTVAPTTVAPTSSTPAGTSVTIARGGFITTDKKTCTTTSCKYVQITSSGWEPNQSLAVTCYSSSGSSGPYPKNADSTGTLNAGTVCFFGNATNVYVSINGVNSNIITPWKDW